MIRTASRACRRRVAAATVAIDRHPRHVAAVALVAGLALCRLPEPVFSLAGVVVALAMLAGGIRLHLAVMMLAVFISAGTAGELRLRSIDADPLAAVGSGRPVALDGDLVTVPRPRVSGGFTMRFRAGFPGGPRQLVEVASSGELTTGLSIGDGVAVTGRLLAVDARAGTPEARSYARFLLRNGVRRKLRATSVVPTGARRSGLYGAVDDIRRRSERTLAAGLPPEPAALLRGMVLGGDAGIPEDTTEAFRVSGLSHILAVSGQNVLLLVILVQAIARAFGLGRRVGLIVPVALICIYVPLCGAQASVVRAGAMGLAGLAAMLASRPSSRVYALLLGAIAVLAWNPRATADVGAQLSFAAVLGIVVFARSLATRLRRWPAWLAEGFAVTAAATVATAPLMAYHFGAFSIVSLAANVLAEPLIGPIVWLGSLAAAIGQISQPAGSLLNAPNEFLLGSLITLAHTAAAMPGAQIEFSHFAQSAFAVSAAAILLAGLAVNGSLPGLGRRASRAPQNEAAGALKRPSATRASGRRIRLNALRMLAIGAGAAAIGWLITPEPVRLPRPSIVFLDVGQGDATLLLGSHGCSALIDGGPPGRGLPARLRRLGVKRLDMILATHPQLDHDGGLGEIAAARKPVTGTFLDGGGNTPEPRFLELRRRLASSGANSEPAVEGVDWKCADLSVRLLGPREQSPAAPPPADPNTRAAVAVVRAGSLTMLAAGDAESPQLLPLPLPTIDLLKVSHHGSKDAGLASLLAHTGPRIAAIEVGAENRYGHPTPQTLAALAASGVSVYRTDRDGTVVVAPSADGVPRVQTHAE